MLEIILVFQKDLSKLANTTTNLIIFVNRIKLFDIKQSRSEPVQNLGWWTQIPYVEEA